MKMKLKKFDKAQLVEFLTAHLEKGVFGIFVLLFLLFCIGALKQKPYDKVPKDFTDTAARIDQKVEGSTFDPATDVPPIQPLPESREIPELVWVTREVWNRPVFDVKKRRPEPKFLPLQDIRVASGYGAVSVHAAGDPAAAKAATPAAAPAAPAGGGGGLRGAAAAASGGGGLRGAAAAAGGATPGGATTAAPIGSVKGKQWAVITGLVPVTAQDKEYRAAFRDVRKSSADGDRPVYHSIDVERAEVPPGTSEDAELKWTMLDRKQIEKDQASIASFDVDPIDPVFRDPVLTNNLPRVVGKEHGRSATHPKIPLGPQPGGGGVSAPVATPVSGGARPGGLRAAAAGAAGGNMTPAVQNAAAPTGPKIEYKLLRFFDFSAQPGKTYRYRVRLVLNNPNYNIGAQYLADAQFGKGATRATPWSDPSPEVTIPRGYSLLAGGIRKATGLTDQMAEVVLRMWDQKEAVDAAKLARVMRGQVANFAAEETPVENGPPKSIAFQTDMLILDMTGGESLPGAARARAPSQVLVLEPNGKLAVKSELVDAETYDSAKKRLLELQEANKPQAASEPEE